MKFSLRFWKWGKGKTPTSDIADYVLDEDTLASPEFQEHRMAYRDEEINALVAQVPEYVRGASALGDLVRLRNGCLARILEINGRLQPIFISPYLSRSEIEAFLVKLDSAVDHRKLVAVKWPSQQDPDFTKKVQSIYVDLGYLPDGADKLDPQACKKIGQVSLKYYQKIPATTLIYGPYRGLLVWHSLGSGKTCTAISAIDNFIKYCEAEHRSPFSGGGKASVDVSSKPHIFIVLPPKKSLETNMRKELSNSCPSIIKDIVERARQKGSKIDMSNRVINRYVSIVSYVSLSNRLKRGVLDLENSLIVADEAHNLNEPPPQFAKQYAYLVERIKATKQCKIMLMTATPIYKSLADLSRILNLLKRPNEPKLPESEETFIKHFFDPNVQLRKTLLTNEIRGLISYVDVEGDQSYFAKKIMTTPVVTHTTPEHYAKWEKARTTEDDNYAIPHHADPRSLVASANPKFKNAATGFYKRSSAITNVPVDYKKHGKWPAKFAALAEQLRRFPKDKHFIFSRHKAQGANAVGLYLEQEAGWVRLSNNRSDHGDHPPTTSVPFARELAALKQRKLDPQQMHQERQRLFQKYVRKPYQGFVVLNSDTSSRESGYASELFNDEANIDGRLVRVFIGDASYSEGVSLMDTLHVHLLEPTYSYQGFRQVVARAVRFCSHKRLADKWPWQVTVHRYVTDLDEQNPMTDNLLMQYAQASQAILSQVIDTAKDSSLEVGFEKNAIVMNPQTKNKLSLWRRLLRYVKRPFSHSAPALLPAPVVAKSAPPTTATRSVAAAARVGGTRRRSRTSLRRRTSRRSVRRIDRSR